MPTLPRNTILIGDVRQRLSLLPSASVDCVITSPPYFQLRDYGVKGQLGLESTVDGWVRNLRTVFRSLARVLKPTGSAWLNLGDAYSRHPKYGAPAKSLLLAPERLVLALAQDGWLIRNKVIWAKNNAMPHSVADRLNSCHDFVYLLVRSPRYFFDLHAIRDPHRSRQPQGGGLVCPPAMRGALADPNMGLAKRRADGLPGHPLGKNPGDVWIIPTRGYKGAHFATFPPTLVRRPLLATCPARVCVGCGAPWLTRVSERRIGRAVPIKRDGFIRRYPTRYEVVREAAELAPGCGCDTHTRPGVVLDPFFGSGTVGVVAEQHGRDWLGIELNAEYVKLARQRLEQSWTTSSVVPDQAMRAAA
jgi:site-specific DNA-methyltransferase (adenine-specific)